MTFWSRFHSLQRKIIAAIVVVGLLPLTLFLILLYLEERRALRETTGANFKEAAVEAARRVEMQVTRTVNEANEYLTIDPNGTDPPPPVTLTHDDNGNLTQDPTAKNAGDGPTPSGQSYEYDVENRLTRVRRVSDNEPLLEIAYDALGRRVEAREYLDAATGQLLSAARVTRHVYWGVKAIEEYSVTDGGSTVTLAREFVWGRRFPEPIAMIDRTAAGDVGAGQEEVLHYLHDVLGSVVALTKASGQGAAIVVERYRYDPYGRTYIYGADGVQPRPASLYGNPFAFTGQRYDAALGLYHFWARTYSALLGRWLQRDPLGYVDGVNLYLYVVCDPLDSADPLGLWSWAEWFLKCTGGFSRPSTAALSPPWVLVTGLPARLSPLKTPGCCLSVCAVPLTAPSITGIAAAASRIQNRDGFTGRSP